MYDYAFSFLIIGLYTLLRLSLLRETHMFLFSESQQYLQLVKLVAEVESWQDAVILIDMLHRQLQRWDAGFTVSQSAVPSVGSGEEGETERS